MSWDLVSGLYDLWADEGLQGIGRARHHRAKAREVPDSAFEYVPDIFVKRSAFVAQRHPWRLTEIILADAGDAPAAVVSWADDAVGVMKGEPARQHLVEHPYETQVWTNSILRQLLEPGPLEKLVPRPWAAHFRVEEELLRRDMTIVGPLVSLGAEHFEVTYDENFDVLTSWTAIIDGRPAERVSLTQTRALKRQT